MSGVAFDIPAAKMAIGAEDHPGVVKRTTYRGHSQTRTRTVPREVPCSYA